MEYNLFMTNYTDYYVCKDGTVFSKYNTKTPLKQSLIEGYYKVLYSIGTGNKRLTKWFRVDYLVASTFISNPNGYRFIRHKDGNNLNNHVDNLEWKQFCTTEPAKIIEGFNNKYIITSSGKVYNNFTGVEMKQKNTLGYKAVALRIYNGEKSQQLLYKIHRLVAKYFIPNPKKLDIVNHKDGNKENNDVSNLEWCTNKENTIHAYRTQLNKTDINLSNGQCIIDLIENFGYNYADVAELLHIKRQKVAYFYQGGYRTFGYKVKNIFVKKHSTKLPLSEDFINKYKNIINS